MDFRSLHYFVAVAEEKSFSKASSRLFIAQPTLSRHIQNLEEELGYKLFTRDTHHVELTREGNRCLLYAKSILSNLEKMKTIYQEENCYGSIRVGYVETVENLLVSAFVKAAHKDHPNVQITVVPGKPQHIRRLFVEDKLDILYIPEPMMHPLKNIQYETIQRQGLSAIVPRNHPLAEKKTIHFADLSGKTVLSFKPENAPEIYLKIQDLLQKHGVRPKMIKYVDEVDQIAMMVESGEGISINASIGVLDKYDVCILPIEDCTTGFDVIACWKKNNPNPVLPYILPLFSQ